MSDVKRYIRGTEGAYAVMVLGTDYDALAARLAEAEYARKQSDEACQKMHDSWGPLMVRLAEAERLLGIVNEGTYWLASHPTFATDLAAFLAARKGT